MDVVKRKGEVISKDQRSLVSYRYKRITQAINSEFWNINNDIEHSLYVGSYGRGTAINTSDIDILVELPKEEYERFDAMKGNGQSRLLQVLKNAIKKTYPKSEIHGDGQVVVIDFTDDIKFEVLPAFRHLDWWGDWNGSYDYPDTNMGGAWRNTDPKVEQQAMKEKNLASNGLLFDTCKHMREIRDNKFSSYHLPGIVIDSFVYHNIADWHWSQSNESGSNLPIGTYEKILLDSCSKYNYNLCNLTAPGSGIEVYFESCIDILYRILKYMSKEA